MWNLSPFTESVGSVNLTASAVFQPYENGHEVDRIVGLKEKRAPKPGLDAQPRKLDTSPRRRVEAQTSPEHRSVGRRRNSL